ncbi:hypothetical protein [Streptomyces sp. NPDC048341]|uniref:hypothetical protein n=1 Tax=unclassified Streptomyces TaxID=2593676 RepID=UPI0034217566
MVETRTIANPIAAPLIAAMASKEGRDAWQDEGRCAPTVGHSITWAGRARRVRLRPGLLLVLANGAAGSGTLQVAADGVQRMGNADGQLPSAIA